MTTLSKKRINLIKQVPVNAFQKIVNKYFDQEEMKDPPEFWCSDVREKWDLLTEMELEATRRLEQLFSEWEKK